MHVYYMESFLTLRCKENICKGFDTWVNIIEFKYYSTMLIQHITEERTCAGKVTQTLASFDLNTYCVWYKTVFS